MSLPVENSIIDSFDVFYLQYLDENSRLIQNLPEFFDLNCLLSLYRQMALTRLVDNRAVKLQRTGRMGTYPSSRGQEAIGVGTAHAMKKEDIYCPYYRDSGALLQRQVAIEEIFSIWGGDERGHNFRHAREDGTICVPIASQCLHAAGMAFALKHRDEKRVVVASVGEGGTSKGDFYEALNLAGVWDLPLVIVVNNNQWAISVPRNHQTRAKTIAQKAIAAGISNIQVDGNDVIAVRSAVSYYVERARQGKGPALIEALSYRLCDHTTADDASRYQSSQAVKAAWKKEPIGRLAHYLETRNGWSRVQEEAMQKELSEYIEQAVQAYLNQAKDSPQAIFDHLYAELPEPYLDQYDALEESFKCQI